MLLSLACESVHSNWGLSLSLSLSLCSWLCAAWVKSTSTTGSPTHDSSTALQTATSLNGSGKLWSLSMRNAEPGCCSLSPVPPGSPSKVLRLSKVIPFRMKTWNTGACWSVCLSLSGFLRLDMHPGPSWQTDLCTDTSPWHEQYTAIHMLATPYITWSSCLE